jgi:tRNA-binding protein
MFSIALQCISRFFGNILQKILFGTFCKNAQKKDGKPAYNFLQLFYNFCPEPDGTGGHTMESKKLEKPRENGTFSTVQGVMKPDEEGRRVFPTMKSLDGVNKKNDVNNTASEAPEKNVEAAPEKIDFSKVKIEPLFEEAVDFDTFSKSDFRAVKVKECVAVPKSKKLLQFTLDDGTGEDRTILSGIHEYYEPEELVGKTCIAIVNLPPRKMMGIDSCGMLISAVHEEDGREGLNLLMVDDRIPAGAKLY